MSCLDKQYSCLAHKSFREVDKRSIETFDLFMTYFMELKEVKHHVSHAIFGSEAILVRREVFYAMLVTSLFSRILAITLPAMDSGVFPR